MSIFIVQVILFMIPATIGNNVKFIYTGISNIQDRLSIIYSQYLYIEKFILENKKTVLEKEKLNDLMGTLVGKKLKLYKLYI